MVNFIESFLLQKGISNQKFYLLLGSVSLIFGIFSTSIIRLYWSFIIFNTTITDWISCIVSTFIFFLLFKAIVNKDWNKFVMTIGLTFAIIGSLVVAFSVVASNGASIGGLPIAGVEKSQFQIGVYITLVGFLIQLIATLF